MDLLDRANQYKEALILQLGIIKFIHDGLQDDRPLIETELRKEMDIIMEREFSDEYESEKLVHDIKKENRIS